VSYPIGNGERKNPKGANCILTTSGKTGGIVNTPLWIDSFAIDLNLQLDTAQLRSRLSHRPIRLTERFLIFNTLWNVKDRDKYEILLDRIKNHWVFNLNEYSAMTPMLLRYFGANKTWEGFIEGGSIGFAVTDVVLRYPFQMRLMPKAAVNTSTLDGRITPYTPTMFDVSFFGDEWYRIRDFIDKFKIGDPNFYPPHGADPGGPKKSKNATDVIM